jgi:GAF domain-containing protein
MISWCEGQFIHERIGLPQELGHEWCQPSEVEVKMVNPAIAPYRDRFLSYGMRFVLLIPVVLNDELKGILLLGSNKSFETQGSRVKRCIDLAGRLAVALASAEREEALYRQAHFDELTGLPNRQLLTHGETIPPGRSSISISTGSRKLTMCSATRSGIWY